MSAIETREALERAITWVDERPNGTSLRVGCEPPHDKPVTRAEVRMTLRALLDSLAAPPVPEDVALALTLIRHGAWQGLGCVTCPKEAECDGDRMLCDDALATITTALHSLTAEVERLRGERDADVAWLLSAMVTCNAAPEGDNCVRHIPPPNGSQWQTNGCADDDMGCYECWEQALAEVAESRAAKREGAK